MSTFLLEECYEKKMFVKLSKSVKKAQGMSSSRVFECKEANTGDVSEHKELIYLQKNIKSPKRY